MRQIALDTETTGLETSRSHRIIEIAGVEIINRKLTGKHFHYYVNPEREIDVGALNIHGITSDFLQDKPLFADIFEAFLTFVKGAELIIHNAAFDVGFINYEFQRIEAQAHKITDYCQIIDTLAIARMRHPGQKNNLDALCQRYEIDNSHRERHSALLDAELLARVYLAMTGGQGSLFGDETLSFQPKTYKRQKRDCPPLLVIKATPEEESLHAQRLLEVQEIAHHS